MLATMIATMMLASVPSPQMTRIHFDLTCSGIRTIMQIDQEQPLQIQQITSIVNTIGANEGCRWSFSAKNPEGYTEKADGVSGARNLRVSADTITGILRMPPLPPRVEVACYAPDQGNDSDEQLVLCWRKAPIQKPVARR